MSEDTQHVVAMGASAGGLAAIRDLIAVLPDDLEAPVVIGAHSSEGSILLEAVRSARPSKIKRAEDGEVLRPGWIYVIPPARHGFFRNGALHLSDVVRDSGYRPSIDALFMTLAAEYGRRAIAVVLSGMMKDGMRCAQVIYDMGGRTIVQDPDEAAQSDMLSSVIRNDHPRAIREASELGEWLLAQIGRDPEEHPVS